MSGLQGILDTISSDGDKEIQKIGEQAKLEMEAILKNGEETSKKACLTLKETAEQKAEAELRAAHSSAEMMKKKAVLNAKNELIQEVITEAREKIKNLPDAQYFAFLSEILKHNAKDAPCKILFCERDYKRLPKDFLKDYGKMTAEISENVFDGFILQYGDIEENCTLGALIDAHIDEIRDIAAKNLFHAG